MMNAYIVRDQVREHFAGSPVFLKSKFGVGYHIVLTKAENCDEDKVNVHNNFAFSSFSVDNRDLF